MSLTILGIYLMTKWIIWTQLNIFELLFENQIGTQLLEFAPSWLANTGDLKTYDVKNMVVDDELYKTLQVPTDATEKDITKAYRTLAMKHHPDKGGDETKFKNITAAY